MSDHYNLRSSLTLSTSEGTPIGKEPVCPGPMSAELPDPAPTQTPEVEAGIEGRPESPQLNVPLVVSTSISMPDLTCYSDFGDDPAPTDPDADTGMMEATVSHTQPVPTLTPQDTNPIPPVSPLNMDTLPTSQIPLKT